LRNQFTTSFRGKTLQSDLILMALPFADPAKEKITVRASTVSENLKDGSYFTMEYSAPIP
jgi:hypothetical protein